MASYAHFRGDGLADWHPTLTDFADAVRVARQQPIGADYPVFERAAGGDEAPSVPLDRTAAGGSRTSIGQTLSTVVPAWPEAAQRP